VRRSFELRGVLFAEESGAALGSALNAAVRVAHKPQRAYLGPGTFGRCRVESAGQRPGSFGADFAPDPAALRRFFFPPSGSLQQRKPVE
jgi:hypothetical protein